MKKQYLKPVMTEQLIEIEHNLLAGSGETGTNVYETTVSGVQGFSRSGHGGWDDDDDE